jgi:hypothetical protein
MGLPPYHSAHRQFRDSDAEMTQAVDFWQAPLTRLSGVGPQLAARLARLDLHRIEDLLFHLPHRYQDRTRLTPIGQLRPGHEALVEGEVQFSEIAPGRRRTLLCRISDGAALPFALTGAQQRVLAEIGEDLRSRGRCCAWCRATSAPARPWSPRWRPCGGRGVACQAALMAPTELLAEQHLAQPSTQLAGAARHRRSLALGRQGQGQGARDEALEVAPRPRAHRGAVGTHALLQDRCSSARLAWPSSTSSTASACINAWRCATRARVGELLSAPAGDDRHADPAHAGDDRLSPTSMPRHRRAAAGPQPIRPSRVGARAATR